MSVLKGGSYDNWKQGPAEDHPDNEEKPQFTESDVRRFVRGAYRQRDEARGLLKQRDAEVEKLRRQKADLIAALKWAISEMKEEENNRERCIFGFDCGNCEAGTPTAHTDGCKAENALFRAERDR